MSFSCFDKVPHDTLGRVTGKRVPRIVPSVSGTYLSNDEVSLSSFNQIVNVVCGGFFVFQKLISNIAELMVIVNQYLHNNVVFKTTIRSLTPIDVYMLTVLYLHQNILFADLFL